MTSNDHHILYIYIFIVKCARCTYKFGGDYCKVLPETSQAGSCLQSCFFEFISNKICSLIYFRTKYPATFHFVSCKYSFDPLYFFSIDNIFCFLCRNKKGCCNEQPCH